MSGVFLFFCPHYYPSGGWEDLLGVYDNEDVAMDALKQYITERDPSSGDWQIVEDYQISRRGRLDYEVEEAELPNVVATIHDMLLVEESTK